ncbi:hypothetical protein [Nodosilinea nodulosa]|uniref:hypothetical protein n=1 Tax=Nodosilinea nodulosa TaxID=416001 RepID=UPI00030A1194|nr:hypothetical protein [Nodosilinea nodulosa]
MNYSRLIEALNNPTKKLFALFLAATMVINFVSDGVTEFLWNLINTYTTRWPLWSQALLPVALLVGLLLLIYFTDIPSWIKALLYRIGAIPTETPQANVTKLTKIYPGLIVAMSPTDDSPAEVAIRYHWNQGHLPHLRHCWLICTDKSLPYANQLVSRLAVEGITQTLKVHYGPNLLIDPNQSEPPLSLLVSDDQIDDPNYIQRLVDAIYADAATQAGLSEPEVIADYTGATKGMTAGILLACATPDRPLQYISQIYPNQLMAVDVSYRLRPIKRRRRRP